MSAFRLVETAQVSQDLSFRFPRAVEPASTIQVAEGQGQSIGHIVRARQLTDVQDMSNHEANLFLCRPSPTRPLLS